MRTLGIVTVGRSDYGIYLPILQKIQQDPALRLRLFVSGTHLSPEFGLTVRSIEADGFEVDERVEMLLSSDSPVGVAKSMGLAVIGFAQVFARNRPDVLVVLGDRFEMHAAALAALPFTIPVAHIHGGELTEGAIDDALRHSMTKLSHLHFVATEEYRQRLEQMGEEPWRVTVSGAPSIDNVLSIAKLTGEELEARFGVRVTPDTILVTYHPTTLEPDDVDQQTDELLAALEASRRPVLFTMPNADAGGRLIRARIERYVQSNSNAQSAENLGTVGYFSALAICAAMVGNSSSGLLEAPTFGLPAVNVGRRQAGRIRGTNVIDVGTQREEILLGLARALDPAFRSSLRTAPNPYGDGHASGRIVSRLRDVALNHDLLNKVFNKLPSRRSEDGKVGV